MYNGLADSIWTGTKHKAEAWKWVKFLSSPACQNIVGTGRRVPGDPERGPPGGRRAQGTGVDVSAFTSYLKTKNMMLFPITDKAPQINLIVQPTLEKILIGSEDPEAILKTSTTRSTTC